MAGQTLQEAWREIERLRSDLARLKVSAGRGLRNHHGSFTCPASTGEYVVTGVGFQPTMLMTFATVANSANSIHNGWGMACESEDGLMQYAMGIRGTEAGPQMERIRAGSRCVILPSSTGSETMGLALTSFDPDGFTVDVAVSNTAVDVIWMVAG
jgi:hypothetical protein